jgi:hypothetical protein
MLIDAHNHVGGPDRGDGASQTPEEIVKTIVSKHVGKPKVIRKVGLRI